MVHSENAIVMLYWKPPVIILQILHRSRVSVYDLYELPHYKWFPSSNPISTLVGSSSDNFLLNIALIFPWKRLTVVGRRLSHSRTYWDEPACDDNFLYSPSRRQDDGAIWRLQLFNLLSLRNDDFTHHEWPILQTFTIVIYDSWVVLYANSSVITTLAS